MELKEKIKAARLDARMTQKQLAKEVGVSLRTIQFYESGERTPQNAAIIMRLAKALNVKTDYFLSNDELEQMRAQDAFLDEAKKQYGTRGKAQATKLLEQTSALFAGGDLSDEDRESFFETVTEIYFDAKKRAKKYAHKKTSE